MQKAPRRPSCWRNCSDHAISVLESSGLEKKLAYVILKEWQPEKKASYSEIPRLKYARKIAFILLDYERNEVRVLLDQWIDFLAYAANSCSRESHARKLSSDGEFTTLLWLMIEHLCQAKAGVKRGESCITIDPLIMYIFSLAPPTLVSAFTTNYPTLALPLGEMTHR